MSKTPGKTLHHPATGPSLFPQDGWPGLPQQNFSNFYRNFFDLIDVMAIMIDDRGIARLFNRKAEKLTGYSRNEVLGQDWFSLLLPEREREMAREQLLGGLQKGVRHMALLMPMAVKTGRTLTVCWSLSLVRDDEGKACGLFGLGFSPAGSEAPCLALGRQMECYCASVSAMTHDLLNHSQVVMGYLEMAAERTGEDRKLQCMLDRATKSIAKCGDMAVNIHRLSNSQ